MFRSIATLTALVATVSGLALAQPAKAPVKADDPSLRPATQNVDIGDVKVLGKNDNPGSAYVFSAPRIDDLANVVLTRDLLVAVQGNVDRESLERQNAETR